MAELILLSFSNGSMFAEQRMIDVSKTLQDMRFFPVDGQILEFELHVRDQNEAAPQPQAENDIAIGGQGENGEPDEPHPPVNVNGEQANNNIGQGVEGVAANQEDQPAHREEAGGRPQVQPEQEGGQLGQAQAVPYKELRLDFASTETYARLQTYVFRFVLQTCYVFCLL